MQPPEVFCKKDVLRNFAKFTGKHPCLKPAALLKMRDISSSDISREFCEISKNMVAASEF